MEYFFSLNVFINYSSLLKTNKQFKANDRTRYSLSFYIMILMLQNTAEKKGRKGTKITTFETFLFTRKKRKYLKIC